MDTIRIKDLALRTIIGIYDWEKEKKQDVVINLAIGFDGSKACASDKIEDTIDYKTIKLAIVKLVEEGQFGLIEHLAQKVVDIVFEDSKALSVTVKIDKPGALRFAKSVSFEMTRER